MVGLTGVSDTAWPDLAWPTYLFRCSVLYMHEQRREKGRQCSEGEGWGGGGVVMIDI